MLPGVVTLTRFSLRVKHLELISVTPSRKTALDRLWQRSNALPPISVTVPGMVISVRPLAQNASAPITVTLSGISMLYRVWQSPNAFSPISDTLSGIVTPVKLLPENALLPILVTPSGIMILWSEPVYRFRTPSSISKSSPAARTGIDIPRHMNSARGLKSAVIPFAFISFLLPYLIFRANHYHMVVPVVLIGSTIGRQGFRPAPCRPDR